MNLTARSVGSLCGVAAALAFIILYLAAMSMDPEYVFFENYLSDLGVREGAWAFNSGVIIAGLLFLAMDFLAVAPTMGKSRAATASVALLAIAALFLVGVGVFTEDAGDIHGIVSYGFFLTMLAALGVLSYALHKGDPLGRRAFVATLAAFLFGLALLPFGGTPAVETLAVLAIIAWGLFISVELFRAESGENAT